MTQKDSGHDAPDSAIRSSKLPNLSVLTLLQTTRRYSSYVFTGFIGLHVVNNLVVPLATWMSDSQTAISTLDHVFNIARVVYRPSAVVEFGVILVPLALHVTSGILLRINRINTLYPKGVLEWYGRKCDENIANGIAFPRARAFPTFGLSDIAASGYITAFCVVFHVYMVRYLPWKYIGDASITIVTRALQKHPVLFYTFYYSLLSAGGFHMISGWGKWLRLTVTPRAVLLKNAVVTLVNLSWVAALIRVGQLGIPQGLAAQYDSLYQYLWSKF